MKVKIVNCEDGKDSICFLSQKPFKTSKGVAYMLNDRIIHPDEALQNEVEFEMGFKTPPNFNTRQGIAQYLVSLGITRNHPSYFKELARLGENLPLGEVLHTKQS
jgi:hypothetical protein